MNSTARFSNRVENYVKFRPDYPPQVIELMREKMGLRENSVVADIGSGTGIFAKQLLETGCAVRGIEPNAKMRRAGDEFLSGFPKFKSIDGTAENTGLKTGEVSIVTAAQAFHWFAGERTKQEFQRILHKSGWIVLIWNLRKSNADAFSADYENLLRTFGTDYEKIIRTHAPINEIADFFDADFAQKSFDNSQIVDFAGLKGRLLSSSYAPTNESEIFPAMNRELERIFAEYQTEGKVTIYYDTKVYYKKV